MTGPRGLRWWLVLVLVALAGPAAAHPPQSARSYRWADPLPWAAVTTPAEGRTAVIPPELFAPGSADFWTPDLQAIMTVTVAGPVATAASASLEPLDAVALPPLDGVVGEPNGNAYRVGLQTQGWRPEGVDLTLTTPFPVTDAVRLGPGGGWVPVSWHPRDGAVVVAVEDGDVIMALAARTDGHERVWDRVSHHSRALGVAAVLLLVAGAAVWSRRRVS